jgi:hypothetical protein
MSSYIVLLCFCSAMIYYITLLHYLLVRFEYLVWTCLIPFTISTSIGYIVEVIEIKSYLRILHLHILPPPSPLTVASASAYCCLHLCLLLPPPLLTAASTSAYCCLHLCLLLPPSPHISVDIPKMFADKNNLNTAAP